MNPKPKKEKKVTRNQKGLKCAEKLLVTFVTEVTLFWSRRVELGT